MRRGWTVGGIGVRGALSSGAWAFALYTLVPTLVLGSLWWRASHPGGATPDLGAGRAPRDASEVPVAYLADATHPLDQPGDGGPIDEPLSAGPEPAGSNGDGTTDAVVDASGADGADDTTQAAAEPATPGATGPKVGAARAARGPRAAGAKGPAELAASFRDGAARRPGRNTCRDAHPDVKPDGADHWEVNRELVDYYTANFKRFNSLGWSGPYESDTVKGWKIGGFGCNSPLYFAGLRRGDVVLTVNEKPTRTWMQILGTYTRLRRKDDFEVVLVRRGATKVLRYTLVDGGPPTTDLEPAAPTPVAPTPAAPPTPSGGPTPTTSRPG